MKETLSFWTNGENFTNLLLTFWEEGQYRKIYDICLDGGLNLIQMKAVFEKRFEFIGDTREGGYLNFQEKEDLPLNFKEEFLWSIINCYSNNAKIIKDDYYDRELKEDIDIKYKDKLINLFTDKSYFEMDDFKIITKFFDRKEILNSLKYRIIKEEGYEVNPNPLEYNGNGVITKEGDYITCEYQEHNYLMPLLYKLEIVDNPNWVDSNDSIHISSGQASMSYKALHKDSENLMIFLKTMFKYEGSVNNFYSSYGSITYEILDKYSEYIDKGGKFNNLMFLQTFFPEIKLPKFSDVSLNIENQCIRTSPKYSLPGLLNSKFQLNENSIKEIENDFEKYKDILSGNKLNYFYQEFIEGINGVCHYWKKGDFSYAVSQNQGDIVNGKNSTLTLDFEIEKKLRKIASDLYSKLKQPIQLEFVEKKQEIYIVQLRILKNNAEETAILPVPKNSLYQGKTFSKGIVECNLDEVLIVEEDAKSEELIGKKALIVQNKVEFSHILALSKSLNIPSIYGTGKVELPNKIKIHAYNLEAFICKI